MVEFIYKYQEESSFQHLDEFNLLTFETDQSRSEKVKFKGKVISVLEYRDAMICLRDIVKSNYIPKIKDRSEYFAWLNRKLDKKANIKLKSQFISFFDDYKNVQRELSELENERTIVNKKITKNFIENFNIQIHKFKQFIIEKQIKELTFLIDPVISVHPDAVIFEALSLDESSYGNLSIDMDQFRIDSEISYGTTNIDFSQNLFEEFVRIRSSDDLFLEINPSGLSIKTNTDPTYIEKKINLPESWINSFLQVSAAMAFPAVEFEISPNDIFNIINFLKGHKAKQSPRALRFDLQPNQAISVIFEPWNIIYKLDSIYKGDKRLTVRIWGRRRILLLERIIPYLKKVNVRLIGKGMPIFFRCYLSQLVLTLGLSGWTKNNWNKGVVFSSILGQGLNYNLEIVNALKTFRIMSLEELESKFNKKDITSTIAYLYRNGRSFFDLNYKKIRYRELSTKEFTSTITELNQIEKEALVLINKIKSYKISKDYLEKITITSEFDAIPTNTTLTLSDEGVYLDSSCTCEKSKTIKSNKLICSHILALISKFIVNIGEENELG